MSLQKGDKSEPEEMESDFSLSESEDDDDEEDEGGEVKEGETVQDAPADNSSDDEDAERCPICLLRLRLQPVGRPDGCKHVFCLVCILEWAKVTPSCPIDRANFTSLRVRDSLDAPESGAVAVEVPKTKEVEVPSEDDSVTVCEDCRRSDREHLLLLCDGCDLGHHTSCLTPPLQEVPLGRWFCPSCRQLGVGQGEQESAHLFDMAGLQERIERTGTARRRGGRRSSRRRRGGAEITRTGHLERIRRAVDSAREQVEVGLNKRKVKKKRKSKGGSGKKKKPGRKRKCKGASKRPSYRERKADAALLDNVRAALGLSAPRVHWSEAQGVQGAQGLALFGSAYDLEPLGSEGEEEEVLQHPAQPSTTVMPRHLAVQRMALARRRRQKDGISFTPTSAPPDLLAGILGAQAGLLAPAPAPARPLDKRYLAPKVKTAPGLNPTKGPAYSTASSSPPPSSSPSHSYGAPAPLDPAPLASSRDSPSSPPPEDLYNNMEGDGELLDRSNERLPRMSPDELRALAAKQEAEKKKEKEVSDDKVSKEAQGVSGGAALPQLSASGLAKLAELYNPEDGSEEEEEEESLVIADDPMKDTDNVSEAEEDATEKKFTLKLKGSKIIRAGVPPNESPKKNLIADIFGSDDDDKEEVEVKSASTEEQVVKEGAVDGPGEISGDIIGEVVNEAVNALENGDKAESNTEKPGEEASTESLEDVSDKEMEESREVRMRELSVSPINSDQSESYEKAATLEGLNPEAISAEEDFTSLSEEEEGEIKNYERKKKLKLRKRELQKKVRELQRKVIEISPSRAEVLANGGSLEDGEIHDQDKKKKLKDKPRVKKKVKKAAEGVNGKAEDAKDDSKNNRNYRKKEADEDKPGDDGRGEKTKSRRKKKEKVNTKPELPRYDVRRILDKKKEEKQERKDKASKEEAGNVATGKTAPEKEDPSKDEFGRDMEKKKKEPKKKVRSRSRSKSRGRKMTKKGRRRSSSPSFSSSGSSSGSSSSSSSESSQSRSGRRKNRLKKRGKTTETAKKQNLSPKKKALPVAEKIRKKMRSRSRSRNKRKRRRSSSRSRSRSGARKKLKSGKRKETRKEKTGGSKTDSNRRGGDKVSSKSSIRRKSSRDRRSRSVSRRKDDKPRSKHRSKSKNKSRSRSKRSRSRSRKRAEVSEKSVYTSGEKILVSVNFSEGSKSSEVGSRSPRKTLSQKKPSVIIDLLDDEAPYRVIETVRPLVDLASDGEEAGGEAEEENMEREATVLSTPSKGPMTPPEPVDRYDPFDPTVSPDNEPESLPACHTPPLQCHTPPLQCHTPPLQCHTPPLQPCTPPGPQTPPPSTSPRPPHPTLSSPGVKLQDSQLSPQKTAYKRAPLYSSLPPNVSATLPSKLHKPNGSSQLDVSATSSGSPMDMDLDCDSPFSPGSASGLSDLFEPPTSSPPPSSLPRIAMPGRGARRKAARASDSSAWQTIIGEPGGKPARARRGKGQGQAQNGTASNKLVQTKVIDNKLKIIDDVPSSAVEMAVKEKFLAKVQRQERIVEEVKLVLKPAYNKKKITKEAYKEILRKTVPKVCHSRYGEINPSKIEKLVQGYIKKHQHIKKKTAKQRKSF